MLSLFVEVLVQPGANPPHHAHLHVREPKKLYFPVNAAGFAPLENSLTRMYGSRH